MKSDVLSGHFDNLEADSKSGTAQKSIEGWIVFATNVHIEATENDIFDKFSEFGKFGIIDYFFRGVELEVPVHTGCSSRTLEQPG